MEHITLLYLTPSPPPARGVWVIMWMCDILFEVFWALWMKGVSWVQSIPMIICRRFRTIRVIWQQPFSRAEEKADFRESTKDEPDGFPTCKNMLYLPGRVWKPSSIPVVCLLLRVWVMFGANRSVPAPPLTSIRWLAYCLEARRDDPVLQRKLARKFTL